MAWTAPTTRATADLITAGIWNTDIVNNLLALHDLVPVCGVYASGAQTIATGTWTAVAFDSEEYDNDGMHDTVTNNDRVTVVTAGRYLMQGTGSFATQPNTVSLGARIASSAGITRGTMYSAGNSNTGNGAAAFAIADIAAGIIFQLQVWHNNGGNLNTVGGSEGVRFSVTRL